MDSIPVQCTDTVTAADGISSSATRKQQHERLSLDEWEAKGHALFGDSRRNFSFRCPNCGHAATPQDFVDAGADPNRAPMECIGRVIGAKGGYSTLNGKPNPRAQPCDWAAFGLLGTLNSGVLVVAPDGREKWIFSFAEPVDSASP